MSTIARVFPYVWPYRGKVLLSFVFAALVALLWGVNLSVAYPVVKVLLQGQNLTEYVDGEIAAAEEVIRKRTDKIENIEKRLLQIEAEQDVSEKVSLLKEQSRCQSELSDASRSLLLMQWLKTHVVPWIPTDQFDCFALILGLLLVATLLKGVCIFVQDVLVGSVVELSIMGIRKECFRRTLKQDYLTLSRQGTPDLMSRFTYDMNVLASGLTLMGGKVIREPLKAATCIVFAFMVNWQLTLMSLLFVPLAGVVFYRIGKKLKQASHRVMESMSRIYKTLEESFDTLKIVIAFNNANQHRRRFHLENKEYFRKAMTIVKIDALTSPTTEVLGMLAAFIALLPGAYLVLRGTTSIWGIRLASAPMDIAQLSVMYVLLAGVIDPGRKLSSVYSKLKRSGAAAERIFSLMDRQPLITQPAEPAPCRRLSRAIEFRGVHFSYSTDQPHPNLKDVNLRVTAGEVVVVVGENGSGKSTLLNLIPRFFDPDRGAILIDDVDIKDLRLRDLRGQIGVVTQETLLFDQSIAANIAYGAPGAPQNAIIDAACKAHALQFIEELPEGFETRVGEKGQRLSGGQRQRLALARAILRDPSILILDEATSAIDSTSESLIHQALRSFVEGRTTFIITHSVSQSMLDFVSRIVVMEQGEMVACGTHEHLLSTCPTYKKLFRAQVQQRAA